MEGNRIARILAFNQALDLGAIKEDKGYFVKDRSTRLGCKAKLDT